VRKPESGRGIQGVATGAATVAAEPGVSIAWWVWGEREGREKGEQKETVVAMRRGSEARVHLSAAGGAGCGRRAAEGLREWE